MNLLPDDSRLTLCLNLGFLLNIILPNFVDQLTLQHSVKGYLQSVFCSLFPMHALRCYLKQEMAIGSLVIETTQGYSLYKNIIIMAYKHAGHLTHLL